MNEQKLRRLVESILLCEMAKGGELFIPVSASNRHIHLSQKDIDQLFGEGYQLKKLRDLVQPGQYACEEKVVLETPKGKLTLRIVGPVRKETQAEITYADAVKLGISPMIRLSGDTVGTLGGILKNADKQVQIEQGIIVAARHLHLSTEQAKAYDLKDGDIVSLKVEGIRETIYNNVVVRAGSGHTMEAHIDREEANAACLQDGMLCCIKKQTQQQEQRQEHQQEKSHKQVLEQIGRKTLCSENAIAVPPQYKTERKLITEKDVKAAYQAGQINILYPDGSIITPLARDAAWEYHMQL